MTIQYEPQVAQAIVSADRYGPQVDLTLGEQVTQVFNAWVKDHKYDDVEGDVILSDGRKVRARLSWKVTAKKYHLEQRNLDTGDGRGMVYYPAPTYHNKEFWA